MENSKIQWCEHTFNPWIGCTKVHEGCTHCYAEADMDKRRGRVKWGPSGTRSKTSAEYWKQPLKWNREAIYAELNHESESNLGKDLGSYERPRVFCASLADVFEDWQGPIMGSKAERLYDVGDFDYRPAAAINRRAFPGFDESEEFAVTMDDLRRDLFALIDATPNLDWLLVTKRPENIRRMWPDTMATTKSRELGVKVEAAGYRPNVWLLTSVSNQETYEKFRKPLLDCRDLSPVLGLSIEPMLGPIDLGHPSEWAACGVRGGINWVIVGGESGPGARPCEVGWIDSIVKQCRDASVPCFVKQLGSNAVVRDTETGGQPVRLELGDKKGGKIEEWPEDLQVRQFPELESV